MAHQSRSLCFPSRLSLDFIFHCLKQASLNAVWKLTFDSVTSQTGSEEAAIFITFSSAFKDQAVEWQISVCVVQ